MTDYLIEGDDVSIDFKQRIGDKVNRIDTRVAVLEEITGKHSNDLGELKVMITRLGMNLEHHAEMAAANQTSLSRENGQQIQALRVALEGAMDLKFAQHEKREETQLGKLATGTERVQKQILLAIVTLLLSVLGGIAYLALDHVPFAP